MTGQRDFYSSTNRTKTNVTTRWSCDAFLFNANNNNNNNNNFTILVFACVVYYLTPTNYNNSSQSIRS
jgi:hypothetical protein